ncbi:cytochrome P450 [Archangium violaceum]|uniref:cytochrome P450 n=1 Tax=Archangium violaceum TaxID=83451 RepID=UPI0019506728|nr:cytochrome P450 [Archangium violaceum]QRN96158.1 cytochrome P450 [Archangium violaceum]
MSGRPNLMTPELKANPYPLYAELRRSAPVSQVDPGGFWAVARFEDAMFVFKNPQIFSSEGFGRATNPPWIGSNPFSESMIAMDPPRHGRLRSLVNRAFGNAAMVRLEPRVRAFAEEVVAALPLGRPVDMIPAFSLPVPASVLCLLLGLDPSLRMDLKRWADQLTTVTALGPADTERHGPVRQAIAEARRYFGEVVEARRCQPGDDMVSELLRAQVEGEALTDDELMAFLFLLLVGGLETTVNLLGLSLLVLMERPELLARLRADRSLLPRFIDEVLRFEAPAQGALRMTTREVELGGVRLPERARVVVLMGSANRDEAHFPDADRFDLDRPRPHAMPFGHGAHFCIGAQLARLEARLALDALLDRCGGLSPVPEPVAWHRSMVVRGPASLHAVVHPA